MNSIIVKLPNWIGDILFSFDLIYSLSRGFDRVGVSTSEAHAELFSLFHLPKVEVIPYKTSSWPFLNFEGIERIQSFGAQIGLLLTNSFGSVLPYRFAGLSNLAGYNTEHRGFLLELSMPIPQYRMHQSEYYLGLLDMFQMERFSWPLPPPEVSRENLVVIHPGASRRERAWHLERYCGVAERLNKRGHNILFVSGEKIGVSPFPLSVMPPFSELASLLRRSSLFIGNDSGPLHLAQQCGSPVVGIYGPGDPLVTGPRPITPFRIVDHRFPCSPCRQRYFRECNPSPAGKPYCIETIGEDEVLSAALALLASRENAT